MKRYIGYVLEDFSTGASVFMEMGCAILLAHGGGLHHLPVSLHVFNSGSSPNPVLWGFLMESFITWA